MNPSDTCILAIDFQENYRPGANQEKTLSLREWNEILANTNRLLATAREVRIPIMHVTHIADFCSDIVPYGDGWNGGMNLRVRRGDSPRGIPARSRMEPEGIRIAGDVVGEWDHLVRLIPDSELGRDHADYLVMKSTRNAFHSTGLLEFLSERGITNVCCTGFEAKDCVMFAAYAGTVRHKLHMTIVRDCTNGAEPMDTIEVERDVQKTLSELGIQFRTADEVRSLLKGESAAVP